MSSEDERVAKVGKLFLMIGVASVAQTLPKIQQGTKGHTRKHRKLAVDALDIQNVVKVGVEVALGNDIPRNTMQPRLQFYLRNTYAARKVQEKRKDSQSAGVHD